MTQERPGLVDFELDIVLTRFGPQPDLLQFCLMNVSFVLFLFLLILELPEVHNSANRRPLIRRNLNKVEPSGLSLRKRIVSRDNSQLGAFCRNHANRRNPDLLVNAMLSLDGQTLQTRDGCNRAGWLVPYTSHRSTAPFPPEQP